MKSKTCYVCGKSITAKNEIGLNRKLLGRNINKFYCYQCLAEQLEIEIEALMAKIEEFKNQGCTLFE
ncbi:hypothetical protein AGMMS49975_23030 [Clostridia bacterium]|nr:hypothetical protein AGMMS49975_23030 [Clostridia bacterium]